MKHVNSFLRVILIYSFNLLVQKLIQSEMTVTCFMSESLNRLVNQFVKKAPIYPDLHKHYINIALFVYL